MYKIFSYICSQLQKTSLVYKPKFQILIKLSIMKHLEKTQMNAVKAGADKKKEKPKKETILHGPVPQFLPLFIG